MIRTRTAPIQKSYTSPRPCFFCTNRTREIDYKDAGLLRRFISSYGKIAAPHRTGTCTKHQRKLARAIKTARRMALLPFFIQ